ncbi:MAG TPA: hypothetical protein V6D05_01490 [Stenomitos sp.]
MPRRSRWIRLYALGLLSLGLLACTPEEDPVVGGVRPKSSPTPKAGQSQGTNVTGSLGGDSSPPPIAVTTPSPTPTPTPTPTEQVLFSYPLQMTSPRRLAFDASGRAWVACAGDGVASGNLTQLSTSGTTMLEPPVGVGPECVAIDGTGAIWTANQGDRTLTKLVPASGLSSLDVGSGPSDLTFDGNGHLWVAVEKDQRLVRVDLSDDSTHSVAVTAAGGVALVGGKLWVSDVASSSVGIYDTAGHLETTVFTGSRPGIVREHGGIVWVLNRSGSSMTRIDPAKGNENLNVGLPGNPSDLAFDAAGNVWVSIPAAGKVYKIAPSGAFLKSYLIGTSPYGLAFAADGRLWVSDRDANAVHVFNP